MMDIGWKLITDEQRDGRAWFVTGAGWLEPETGGWVESFWIKTDGELLRVPTHYYDFGLDTPLPQPPKEAE